MKITKTKEEMLAYARRVLLLEPLRSDCVVEYTDGVDTDAILEERLRMWYLSLLTEGDRSLLAEKELSEGCTVVYGYAPAGGTAIRLPDRCVRAFGVRLSGWKTAAQLITAEAAPALLRRQANPFTAATASAPVAVMNADGRTVFAYPAGEAIESLTGVTDDGRDTYSLDEKALDSIRNIKLS